MPGIIVFQRRWSVGSDDLVVPGITMSILHGIWLIVVVITLALDAEQVDDVLVNSLAINALDGSDDDGSGSVPLGASPHECRDPMQLLLFLHAAKLVVLLALEICMARLALRGTMWDTQPRSLMEYILYARLLVLIAEMIWSAFGIVWLHGNYVSCPHSAAKEVLLGSVIFNLCVALSIIITVWCTFDRAGRSWVKMTRFQRSMKEGETKYHYKRSGSHRPNWRQRKVMRTYQDTWNHRCKILFCCMGRSDQYQDSFSEIARLLTDFFRDLDLVPTDIVAGLVLLRKQQKKMQQTLVGQDQNDIYEFLSGVPITSRTRFLSLHEPDQLEAFQQTAYYMKYALAAYGWPMYLLGHSKTGLCRLTSHIRCCCCCCCGRSSASLDDAAESLPVVIGDTCSGCHVAALKQSIGNADYQVIYASFHVDVSETPFFVAVDYDRQSVVVSIRGTISMKDVITDLHAEAEPIPLQLTRDDWFGHKGMVQSASYIRNKLDKENLLTKAFCHNPSRGTADFRLVLVGHSLGAGTAAILALLLRHEYPNVHCYAYSPPGGLLSLPAAEFTKEFVTSVVVGKDVVPRLGLHQLETLRTSLMTAIKKSTDPKWKILGSSMMCCGRQKALSALPNSPVVSIEETGAAGSTNNSAGSKDVPSAPMKKVPSETNISLSTHQPLYPPGRIVHIVRQHPKSAPPCERLANDTSDGRAELPKRAEPIYQAIWADTIDFNEVLISPVMVHDHMPDTVLSALNKVLACYGPNKPRRVSPLRTEDDFKYSAGNSGRGSTCHTPPPPPPRPVQSIQQRPFLAANSLVSIERSPVLGQRCFDTTGEGFYSSSVPTGGALVSSWLSPADRRATTGNIAEASCDPRLRGRFDDVVLEYASRLVAPIATPETLSEESMAGSVASIARRAQRLWRRERTAANRSSIKRDFAVNQQPGSCSDLYEMTESSSVYCASPLSSARTSASAARASRAQLKREIMRLYQRAAADVDKIDSAEKQALPVSASGSSATHSRSASVSSASQPTRLFVPLDQSSPVFPVRTNSNSSSSGSQQRYAISPVASRPATANGAAGHQTSPTILPPCNTSF